MPENKFCIQHMETSWKCPDCGIETCDNCFDRYALCQKCSKGKTDSEALQISKDGGWDWKDEF